MFSAFLWSQKKTTGFSGCSSLVIIRFWVQTLLQVFITVTPAVMYQSAHSSFKRWRLKNVYHRGARTIKKQLINPSYDSRKTVSGLIVAMQHGPILWSCFSMQGGPLSRRTARHPDTKHTSLENKKRSSSCAMFFNERSEIYTKRVINCPYHGSNITV